VLQALHQDFAVFLKKHPLAVVNLIETKATRVSSWGIELQFVEPNSAGSLICSY